MLALELAEVGVGGGLDVEVEIAHTHARTHAYIHLHTRRHAYSGCIPQVPNGMFTCAASFGNVHGVCEFQSPT